MKRLIFLLFALFFYFGLNAQRTGSPNPAARYCKILGYDYKIIKGKTGEKGVCILPDGSVVDAWDFYKGKVGQEYSYCALKGYSIELKTITQGSFTKECPICVQKDKGIEIPMDDLMKENGIFLLNDPKVQLDSLSSVIQHNQSNLNENSLILESLPTSFDWRNRDGHAYIGGVRDQGDCGSCYAFAAVAAAECTFNWKNHFRDNCRFEFSESFIMWCLGSIEQWGDNFYGCDGADYSYTELTALCDSGICYRSDYPYTINEPENCTHWNDPRVSFSNWNRVSCNDVEAIKTAIYTYGVVDAAVILSTTFMQYDNGIYSDSYTSCSSSPCYYTPTNHSVSLVGWGHDGTYGDYWILRNSWGEDWGEDGYMRITVNSARVACEVTYLEAIPMTVTGSNIVCNSPNQTYTLNNLPSGTTVSWTKSNNLQEYGHTLDTYTVYSLDDGLGWVQANITNNDCNDPSQISKTVWAGKPIFNSIAGPFPPYIYKGCTGQQYTFYAVPERDPLSQSSYQWMVEPGYLNWYFQYQYYDWVTIVFNDPYDYYQVIARATNTCGQSNWVSTLDSFGYIQIMDCYFFSIYPNPASEYITITLTLPENDKDFVKLSEFNVQIIDNVGISYYSTTKTEDSFTIPVSHFKDGNYFVRITYGNNIESLPLIIKH